MPLLRLFLLALLLLDATVSTAAVRFAAEPDIRDAPLHIPIADPAGGNAQLQGHLCFPASPAQPRVVVINHGSPPSDADRPGLTLAGCHSEAVRWFLDRHYAVALVIRLGYGATGGSWSEGYTQCSTADFYQAGLETARQINVIVDFLAANPALNPNGMVIVGQSAGGWGAIAYDSLPHPHVAAFINMAGGRGGHYHSQPGNNCHPERLVAAAARYGHSARTPALWIYAQNDSYFDPPLAQAMYRAFTQAGGRAEWLAPAAFSRDGHHLFFGKGGTAIWGPPVAQFLHVAP